MTPVRPNTPQIIHQTVDDEVVIVDLMSGSYFSLRGSAEVIWAAMERGDDRPAIIDAVASRYEADRHFLENAIDSFLAELRALELVVEGSNAPAAAAELELGAEPPAERVPFEAPVLERFDDLQDLILLDPVHEVTEEEGWPHARSAGEG